MVADGNGYLMLKVTRAKPGPVCSICKQSADSGLTFIYYGPYRQVIGPVCAASIATAWTA